MAQVKTIHKGTKVGYGCKFTAEKNLKIATLPIGYADGFTRMLKKWRGINKRSKSLSYWNDLYGSVHDRH